VRRLLIAIAAAFAAGIIGVIGLAIIDLYMSGHGLGSLTRETLTWEAGGVHMSTADVILMVFVAAAAAAGAWLGKGKA
jgi:hypothetical protein